eukprot:CAMPEP_0184498864 /NCGR_PEP_ID=MMETSP0113_2-20130426/40065_1 /TAXON_ID=91329 /ORGANISM="Norrisiella sphaerica, Strain BC52" /LENGTH=609 /DNA_ID=CAMNT_0026886563 /DNA_START=89 /DNA_END=1918 /DNA_ORIENTATION=+
MTKDEVCYVTEAVESPEGIGSQALCEDYSIAAIIPAISHISEQDLMRMYSSPQIGCELIQGVNDGLITLAEEPQFSEEMLHTPAIATSELGPVISAIETRAGASPDKKRLFITIPKSSSSSELLDNKSLSSSDEPMGLDFGPPVATPARGKKAVGRGGSERIKWRSGIWKTNKNFKYRISENGDVYYKSPHHPWASISFPKSDSSSGKKISSRNIELINLIEGRRYRGTLKREGCRIDWEDGDDWTLQTPAASNRSRRSRCVSDSLPPRHSRSRAKEKRCKSDLNGMAPAAKKLLGPPERQIFEGSLVRVRSMTSGSMVGKVLTMEKDGKYRIQVEENGRKRVFSTSFETLRLDRGDAEDQEEDLPAETAISQVENRHYTHTIVRALTRTTGIPITHSGVLVETRINSEPIAQTVVDLIEFQGRPYVAIRYYMQSHRMDDWDDDNQIVKFYREDYFDGGKKPWSKTTLSGKPVSYRVWAKDTTDKEEGNEAHQKWIGRIEECIRESTNGEFKLISRNCQHAAAYTMNKLKAEAGVADDRHAAPPNWVFRVFAPASTWVPTPESTPKRVSAKKLELPGSKEAGSKEALLGSPPPPAIPPPKPPPQLDGST